MSNSLLTIADITNEGLMILENSLTLTSKLNREYDDRFGMDGAKIGYTINLRKPARFTVSGGPALNVQDFVETSVPATLTNQAHIDTQFITSDLLLSMDMFSSRVLKPKIAALANSIDANNALQMMIGTANIVAGTVGTTPTALDTFLTAGAILDTEAAPRDGERYMVTDPFTQASMVKSLTGLFNPQVSIGEQYKKGLMARDTVGFEWYMDQNITSQTYGNWAGSPVYNATYGSSAVLATGWADSGVLGMSGFTNASSTIKVGDTFTIAGVYMVNPQNRATTKQLRTFVVRPPVGSPATGTFTPVTDAFGNVIGGTYNPNSSGQLSLTVAVAVIYGGQFQNVSAAPITTTSVITPTGTSVTGAQNLAFHRDAFTVVSADLPLPGGVDMAARAAHKDVGVSMRIVRQYTINNDALPTRIDILYGIAPMYRELACRVSS